MIARLLQSELYHLFCLRLIERIDGIFQGDPIHKYPYTPDAGYELHLRHNNKLEQFIFVRLKIQKHPQDLQILKRKLLALVDKQNYGLILIDAFLEQVFFNRLFEI